MAQVLCYLLFLTEENGFLTLRLRKLQFKNLLKVLKALVDPEVT